ncbi:restriction endonuclease subunit S [Campylobacter jejuni]|uniref:Restriction endonuclease subunit S n=1 Tax=Campylobacter jejuni TaxID=197 RepID=A0A690UWL9_CAMJU|nr:restriction endonuclease subunit S [Campylobacter jejuni]EAI4846142.1 restriction endonuclease subunit S [Campylobacter jejuni]EAI6346196.1 restriction endonuclease subunit S [Campylobacter jejuni]EAI8595765.1 restriction endonuclease subunit S [Campylobacter jejuni]EAI8631638.1 restriction endonuclease subunit S [Campylobacter jejuni]EAJ5193829.1 restriction endonuclease subunit S [Campylobacter jejuni]
MTNLPQGWEVKRLEEVCEVVMGQSPNGNCIFDKDKNKDLIEFHQGKIAFSDKYIDESNFVTSDVRKIAKKNSVVLCVRAPVGEVNITTKDIAIGRGLCSLNGVKINNNFLFFYLLTLKKYFNDNSTGSTFKAINVRVIKETKIPLPLIKEQKRIVGILDFAFSKIDENIKKAKENLANIDELMQSALQKAFNPLNDNTKENYQLPQSWEWKSLDNIGEIITGTTPSKNNPNFYGNEYPLFKPSDLNGDMIIKYASDNLSKLGFDNARNIPKDTILVVCIGASIGKIGLSGVSGSCNQQINAIIPNSKFLPKFLFFLCLSNYFQEILKNNASQTTLPIINKTEFSKLQIPLPPLQEQEQIAEHLDFVFEKAKALKELYTKELKDYEELKQSLLDKAFKGEL